VARDTVTVKGYREFLRACDRAGKETKKEIRGTFREVGEVVRVPWAHDLDRFGTKTARGLRVSVAQKGVSVRQSLRKTTGTRPDFGRIQQTFGDAVLASKQTEVEHAFEKAIDRVADHFDN
jgi:hypothetical protein